MAYAKVIDLTHLQTDPPLSEGSCKLRGGKVVKRDPRSITGIVLHQMGTEMGVGPRLIREAGGNKHKALHLRALRVHAHMSAFDGKRAGVRCGHAVLGYPLTWHVQHANGLNSRALGIEVEGNYPAEYTENKASDRVIGAARAGVRYLVQEGRRAGMPIEYIWAHRQSNPDRGRDPGPELWKRVVLEYAVPVLGLKIKPEMRVSGGRSIPRKWGWLAIGLGTAGTLALGVAGFFLYRFLKRRRARGMSGLSSGLGGLMEVGSG